MRALVARLWCFLLPWTLSGAGAPADDSLYLASLRPLRVLADDSFTPLSRWNPDTAAYEGIAVDLFRQAADRLGLRYEFIHEPGATWKEKVDELVAGRADVLLPVSRSDERSAGGLFTAGYYDGYYGVIAPRDKGRTLARPEALAGYRVGVTDGTSILPYVAPLVPRDRLVTFPTTQELYQAVRSGQVDFALQNLLVFREDRYNQELFDLASVLTLDQWPRQYAFYLPKTDASARLVPLFNHVLATLDATSLAFRYERGEEALIQRYTAQSSRQTFLVVGLIGASAVLVVLGLILWNQRRLKESEARFRALSEASFGGIAIHENGVILECNQGLSDMSGYSRKELIGMNGLMLVTPGWRDQVLANIRADYQAAYEAEGLRKDGTFFPMGIRGRNIPYQGRTVRVTEFFDVTGQKIAEAETRRAKRQYDTLVAKIPVGVYIVRTRPDGRASFVYVSPPMTEMVGVPESRLMADYAAGSENIHPDDLESFHRSNAERIPLRKPFDWVGRFVLGGQVRWLSISSLPDPQDNGDVLWHGMVVDITERKLSGDKIRALLEEKNLILREVHHRIKNNMSTIGGLLTLQAATLTDEAAIAALEDAKGRVVSMMVLYDRLYQSDNNQEASLASYLPPLVDQVLGHFPNVDRIRHETRADDVVLGAQTLSTLGIIVNELLTNAMKYAFVDRASGTLTITARQADGTIQVAVEDDGRGLPDDFDLARPRGFGLGLVDMLVKSLRGQLRVERVRGTRFVLEFPGDNSRKN